MWNDTRNVSFYTTDIETKHHEYCMLFMVANKSNLNRRAKKGGVGGRGVERRVRRRKKKQVKNSMNTKEKIPFSFPTSHHIFVKIPSSSPDP